MTSSPKPCPFCDYKGPSGILKSTEHAFVIAPLGPVVPGHVIVIPHKHVTDFTQDPELTGEVVKIASAWAQMWSDCNLITSKGDHATQSVKHLHVHVVPRHKDDGLSLPWTIKHTGDNK